MNDKQTTTTNNMGIVDPFQGKELHVVSSLYTNNKAMNDKQQTATQWLIEQLMADKTSAWENEIKQALIMERDQIEKAYDQGYNDSYYKPDNDGKQYFTDTYKTEQ